MASRRERKQRRAREASAVAPRRQVGTRALLVGAIIAAIVGFSVGWLVRTRTGHTPEERAREKAGEVRERVRELTR